MEDEIIERIKSQRRTIEELDSHYNNVTMELEAQMKNLEKEIEKLKKDAKNK